MVEHLEGFKLSPQQRRLWWLAKGDQCPYRAACVVRIDGALDAALLERAVRQVVERHEVLRTTYRSLPGMALPVQVIAEAGRADWQVERADANDDGDHVDLAFRRELAEAFDLVSGPLLRTRLLHGGRRSALILSMPALAADSWSLRILVRDIAEAYAAGGTLGPASDHGVRYVQFSEWQHELLAAPEEEGAAFWRSVDGTPASNLGFPFQLPAGRDRFSPEALSVDLDPASVATIERTAQRSGASVAALLLAAWATLLWRFTGAEEVVIGDEVAGRDYEVLHGTVGLMAKYVPIPCRFRTVVAFKDLMVHLSEFRRDAHRLAEFFLWERDGAAREGAAYPSIDFVFDDPAAAHDGSGALFSVTRQYVCFDRSTLKLVCRRRGTAFDCELHYDASRYARQDVERVGASLGTLLASALRDPETSIDRLEVVSPAERRLLVITVNETARDLRQGPCVHELFEEQARRLPERPAVIVEDRRLTYAELNAKANRLAWRLRRVGVGPDVPVGICIERSVEMFVAMLGVLKAGGAYVALDPAQPRQRLGFMLEDSKAAVLLTQHNLLSQLPERAPRVLALDADWDDIAQESAENPAGLATRENLVYIVFTSGSTGRPKGVAVEHRQLLNYLHGVAERLDLPADGSYATVSTFAADLGNTAIFPALCRGGTLHVISQDRASDPAALAEYFQRHPVDCLKVVPSHMAALRSFDDPRQVLPRQRLILGGEATQWEFAEGLLGLAQDCRMFNHYGPSETTVGVLTSPVEPSVRDARSSTVPIGRPLPNMRIYLLDAHLAPVPYWMTGEVYIAGAGVARGYFDRPEFTAERFVPDPFSPEPGGRAYRAGDLARHVPGCGIEFLGRADNQIKFHGFRVELDEIRAALNRHPSIRDSIVTVAKDQGSRDVLLAYYVSRQPLEVGELRRFLEGSIPEETLPNHFCHLRRLPLTLNGKIRFEALPTLEQIKQAPNRRLLAPRTPTEELLAGIWAGVLGLERVGIEDNFFELGGHSLLATQLISRVRQVFQVEVALRHLFETPTLAGFAARLEQTIGAGQGLAGPPIEPVPRQGPLELSFAQERLWFMHQLDPVSPAYNVPAGIRLTGRLDVAALERSLDELVRRHQSLRTTFESREGEPLQVVHPPVPLPGRRLDLRSLPVDAREAELRRLAADEARQPFSLDRGPLLRVMLLQLGEQEHALFFTMHHIISDGWSIGILIQEVGALYEAFSAGRPSPLPEMAIQYADFACWQRRWLQGDTLKAQLDHWRRRLAGAPELSGLPTDRLRSQEQSLAGASLSFELLEPVVKSLRDLSRAENATLFMTLLAAFNVLILNSTGQEDVVVGTDVANRNRLETERLIGFFVNHLVLRTDLSGDPSFRDLLRRVRTATIEAYAHQDLPFEVLVKHLRPRRSLGQTPLFQLLFVLQNAPAEPLKLPGLALSAIDDGMTMSKFEAALFMRETGGRLHGTWTYRTALFEASTIARLTRCYVALLDSIAKQPDAVLSRLEMPSASDERQGAMKMGRDKTRSLRNIRRRAVDLEDADLVKAEALMPGTTLPLTIRPAFEEVDAADWAAGNRETMARLLREHGALLFRGFGLSSVADFERFAQAACPELFSQYGDLPREEAGEKTYQSTPYPPDKTILFHNESSHTHRWPLKQMFFCAIAAQEGGETPIVDCRAMYKHLPSDIRERLRGHVVYRRNFIGNLDVSWQDFFKTDDKAVVEDLCRCAAIEFEWTDGGLHTQQVCPALARHPLTGEMVFFNQLQLHHTACLDPEVRESLRSVFSEGNLPRDVRYADGSPIEDAVMERISELYWQLAVEFRWQEGDVLLLDNMLVAHARRPYSGPRKIVVAMGEMVSRDDILAAAEAAGGR